MTLLIIAFEEVADIGRIVPFVVGVL